MLERLTERWVEGMIAGGVIERERAPLYAFGMLQGVRTLIEIVLMLVTSLAMGVFLQGLIMMLAFCPIRIYAGGYHAKTPMQCAFKSWLMFAAVLAWIRFLPTHFILEIAVLVVTGLFLVFLCPMPDEHRPLEDFEIPRYRRYSFILYGLEVVLYVAGLFIWEGNLSRSIIGGMGMLLIVWVAYLIKKKWDKK